MTVFCLAILPSTPLVLAAPPRVPGLHPTPRRLHLPGLGIGRPASRLSQAVSEGVISLEQFLAGAGTRATLGGNRAQLPSAARGRITLYEFGADSPRAGWVSGAEKAQARADFEAASEQLQSLDYTAWADLLQSQDAGIARTLLDEFLVVYINSASRFLEAWNIQHRIETFSPLLGLSGVRIAILPAAGSAPLSKIAASLSKRGYQMIVDPGAAVYERARGWLSAEVREIAIDPMDLLRAAYSRDEVIQLVSNLADASVSARLLRQSTGTRLGEVSLHELRHYRTDRKRRLGEWDLFQGDVSARNGPILGFAPKSAYSDYLSLDELDAYFFETRVLVRRLVRIFDLPPGARRNEAAAALFEDLERTAQQGKYIAEHLREFSGRARQAIDGGAQVKFYSRTQAGSLQLNQNASPHAQSGDWVFELQVGKLQVAAGDEGRVLKEKLDGLEEVSSERLQKWVALLASLERIKQLPPGREKIAQVRSLSREF